MKETKSGIFTFFIILFSYFIIYSVFISWSFRFQLIDDAYISFQYGKNFINGSGLVFNPGEYVEGYTNFLWTIITSPFIKIGVVDISVFAIILGIMITLFSLFVLYRVSCSIQEYFDPALPLVFLLPSVFMAVDNSVAFWAVSGLETSLFVLFLLIAMYYYFNLNNNAKNIYWFLVSCIFCTLTRPEGNLVFALFFLNLFIFRKQINGGWRKLFTLGLLYIVFALIYYSFKYFYYGSILPNTFYAKGAANFDLNVLLGYGYVKYGLKARILALILLLIPVKFIRSYRISFLYMFFIIYVAYVISVGGDWPAGNRFLVPVLPALYLLSFAGIETLAGWLKKVKTFSNISKKYLIFGLGFLLAGFLLFNTMKKLEYTSLVTPLAITHEKEQAYIGKWLKVNAPPNSIVATGLAGKIPYYSGLYAIDMLGLCNQRIARMETDDMVIAHQKFDMKYVLSFKPDYIVGGYSGFNAEEIPDNYELIIKSREENGFIPVYKLKTN